MNDKFRSTSLGVEKRGMVKGDSERLPIPCVTWYFIFLKHFTLNKFFMASVDY